MHILVTGGAGFIGSHTIKKLMDAGHEVICLDDFNTYYNPQLKEDRIRLFLKGYDFPVFRTDIRNMTELRRIFSQFTIDKICHLAARAGVRASLKDPFLYEEVNIRGTMNLLELAREHHVQNFVLASTSSVYGGSTKLPFSEDDSVDRPISPYAATKRACELLGHYYHHLYELTVICLRFFTVYGPWGRPDMALFSFTDSIMKGRAIEIYNHGKMKRDFTYIDDIVNGIIAALDAQLGYEIINLGNNHPEDLMNFIAVIEKNLGKSTKKNFKPLQPGDVVITYADIQKAQKLLGFHPQTNIHHGIPQFTKWYQEYFHIS